MDHDKPPPDPGEDPDLADIELAGDEAPDELGGSEAIVAIGDKILERAEREALDTMPPLPPPDVLPSGRLIPKGDSEEPGEISKILK